jgi:hypothetical protein
LRQRLARRSFRRFDQERRFAVFAFLVLRSQLLTAQPSIADQLRHLDDAVFVEVSLSPQSFDDGDAQLIIAARIGSAGAQGGDVGGQW